MRAQKKGECRDEWRENVSKDKEREKKKKLLNVNTTSAASRPASGTTSSHRDRTEISALLHSSTVRLACCDMF